MKLYYTIGEVARIFNISIDTLRYYDKLDILKPYTVGDNGYRCYYIGQFEIISTIKLLKGLDFTLDEIKELTHQEDLEEVKLAIEKKRLSTAKKIQHLQMLEEKAEMVCDSINYINTSKGISLRKRPELWALLTESLYESKDNDLPSKIERNLSVIDKDWISFANIVSGISPDNFKLSQYHSYLYNGLISTRQCNTDNKELRHYKEEECAFKCITVDHDKYDDLDKEYDEIREWIENNDLDICGDIWEMSIYNQFLHNKVLRNHLQIWIPVKRK